MRTVTTPTQSLGYEYDVGGVRQTKVVGGTITRFTVDENRPFAQVLEERDSGGGLLNEYIYGTDLISQDINGLGQFFYHYDGLGSTRAMTDGSEAVTDTYNYRAFGELLNGSGATPNSYQFAGEQLDGETGDYYLRARYLDTSTGRFRRMDDWMGRTYEPITLNKYLYGNSSPLNFIDPSGNLSLVSSIGAIATLGLALDIASIRLSTVRQPSGYTGLNWRPDSDGKITQHEALFWWKNGGGKSLRVPLSSLDLSDVSDQDFYLETKDGKHKNKVVTVAKLSSLSKSGHFRNIDDAVAIGIPR